MASGGLFSRNMNIRLKQSNSLVAYSNKSGFTHIKSQNFGFGFLVTFIYATLRFKWLKGFPSEKPSSKKPISMLLKIKFRVV